MAARVVSCPIWCRFRQATCLRMTVKYQTHRLLHVYTRHMAPFVVPTTHCSSTHRYSLPIQSRCMSTDNAPTPGKEPNTSIPGLPLVDAEKGNLVYYGPITKSIKIVKIFSVSTSGIALSLLPFVMPNILELPAVLQFMLGSGVSFFMLGTPLLIHALTKRYVTDLYYNKDSNTFTVSTLTFFCRRKVRVFTPEDVTFPSMASVLCFMKVKGTPFFVDPSKFRSRDAYIKLMGYDKPMDFSDIEGFEKKNEE
ncbi:transmembrane protein 70 homolog, mitochondrial-like [Pecten maximus]|uniref:transmembrane protein 70 homolog, mitochondrial-like n=1 Tax=Pecten maximus TaxID=6579 RepID=UPI001457F482|nr:transmembrane protein 70 homolog, mitochondrial-like [Pecten maximus]